MFIRVRDETVTIEEPHNFRAFKVVVETPNAGLDGVRIALANLAVLPDRTTAWVAADALRQRPEVREDAWWQRGFDAMIEKAKPFGWIDESGRSIKAHVEWAS